MMEIEKRDLDAFELRKAGTRPARIAEVLGFEDEQAVLESLNRTLGELPTVSLDHAHRLELERLDALQRALWTKALEGRWLAVDRCLAIMERRARLLGLDGPREDENPKEDRVDDLAARRDERRARGAKTADMPRP